MSGSKIRFCVDCRHHFEPFTDAFGAPYGPDLCSIIEWANVVTRAGVSCKKARRSEEMCGKVGSRFEPREAGK